jgi:hypothetical protein
MAGNNQKTVERLIIYNLLRDHRITIIFHKRTVGTPNWTTGAQDITTEDITSRKCAQIPRTQKEEFRFIFHNMEFGGGRDENSVLIIVKKNSLYTTESGTKIQEELDSAWWFELDGRKYEVDKFTESVCETAYLIKGKGLESNDGSE